MLERMPLPSSDRDRLERAIERLIDLLDSFDADPDLEPDADLEASLGATEHINQARAWDAPRVAEADLEYDGESAASADDEPWLGARETGYRSQEDWAVGSRDDREDAHEGDEPDVGEPSLGSLAVHADESQEAWAGPNDFGVDLEAEDDGARDPFRQQARERVRAKGRPDLDVRSAKRVAAAHLFKLQAQRRAARKAAARRSIRFK